jgi:hypothetical protein
MRYQSANETNTAINRIDGDEVMMFILDADGPLQAGYRAWLDAGNTVEPYVAPRTPVPQTISDRQFFQMATISGLITQADALAAVQTGTIPPVLAAVIDGLPDDAQKFVAQMTLAGATIFERHHPLTEAVGVALGWTSEQIDQFFIQAAEM